MKILIAEDDMISRGFIEQVIKGMGHEVLAAEDGQDAWELFQEHRTRIVITDWMMPKMDGLALCRAIRAHAQKQYTYIIMITAKDAKEDLLTVFESGVDDYIAKPFDPEELIARVKTSMRIVELEERHQLLQHKLLESSAQIEEKNRALEETLKRLSETQAQIIQAEKLASLGHLAAGVAHEINNPTGFIRSNLKTLASYLDDIRKLTGLYGRLVSAVTKGAHQGGEVAEIVDKIRAAQTEKDFDFIQEDIDDLIVDCHEGTQRIAKIVKDLKIFAHPGEDQIQLTDINQGLESTLNVAHNELKYKAVVSKELDSVSMVMANPQQLNQVFMNILINAAQSIEGAGEIQLTSKMEDGWVVVTIRDNGCGMAEEELDKIFDPFYTTKDVGQGTGLGMNIAYNIIKKHRGTITVESQLGQGTTFTIKLPAAD